ncbi:hypothetical protein BGW42_007999 [Actinomortierella wolfii]|nr:hypothetical protein BGW42_007999 [Actinomortierella wolfii]
MQEDTWEPESNVLGDELIEEFEQARAQGLPHARSLATGPGVGGDRYAHHHLPPHHGGFPVPLPPSSRHHPMPPYPLGPSFLPPGPYPGPLPPPTSLPAPPNTVNMYGYPMHYPAGPYPMGMVQRPPMFLQSLQQKADRHLKLGAKRKKDGTKDDAQLNPLKKPSHTYTGSSSSTQGSGNNVIRVMNLDLDHERTFFRATVQRSELISDPKLKTELIQYLTERRLPPPSTTDTPAPAPTGTADPSSTAPPSDDRVLSTSETWLIEIKVQEGKDGSLYLGLDIPRSVVKAVFIPEWMMAHQRKLMQQQKQQQQQQQGEMNEETKEESSTNEGLILKDRVVVTALMAGDLQSSGVLPSAASASTPTSASVSGVKAAIPATSRPGPEDAISQTTDTVMPVEKDISRDHEMKSAPLLTSEKADQTQKQEETSRLISSTTLSTEEIRCKREGCGQTLSTKADLSRHIQQEHLQDLDNSTTSTTTAPAAPTATGGWPALIPHLPKLGTLTQDMTESSWQERCEVIQEAYDSLYSQVGQLHRMLEHHDARLREATVLYTTMTKAARENTRLLEARLEWEVEKWQLYEDHKRALTVQYPELEAAEAQVAALKAARASDGQQTDKETEKEKEKDGEKAAIQDGADDVSKAKQSIKEKGEGDIDTQSAAKEKTSASKATERAAGATEKSNAPLEASSGAAAATTAAEKRMDGPMAKQSVNTIREIQRMLAQASADQERLERENQMLFEQKRQLDGALNKIQDHYRQTLIQLQQLEAKDRARAGEIASKHAKVAAIQQQMVEQKEVARSKIEELLQRIEGMLVNQQSVSGGSHESTNNSTTDQSSEQVQRQQVSESAQQIPSQNQMSQATVAADNSVADGPTTAAMASDTSAVSEAPAVIANGVSTSSAVALPIESNTKMHESDHSQTESLQQEQQLHDVQQQPLVEEDDVDMQDEAAPGAVESSGTVVMETSGSLLMQGTGLASHPTDAIVTAPAPLPEVEGREEARTESAVQVVDTEMAPAKDIMLESATPFSTAIAMPTAMPSVMEDSTLSTTPTAVKEDVDMAEPTPSSNDPSLAAAPAQQPSSQGESTEDSFISSLLTQIT